MPLSVSCRSCAEVMACTMSCAYEYGGLDSSLGPSLLLGGGAGEGAGLATGVTLVGTGWKHTTVYPWLTRWGRMMHICVIKLSHHWFRQWLVAWQVPSHYLNQCRNIVNWTLGNKFQWNFHQNMTIFFKENKFENVIWKMSAILSWPQCVKSKAIKMLFVNILHQKYIFFL